MCVCVYIYNIYIYIHGVHVFQLEPVGGKDNGKSPEPPGSKLPCPSAVSVPTFMYSGEKKELKQKQKHISLMITVSWTLDFNSR